MNWYEQLADIKKIKDAMQDEESLRIFNARVDFMCTRDKEAYFAAIDTLPKKWKCSELLTKLNEQDKKIIVYGYNQFARDQKRVLELSGFTLSYWCDKDETLIGKYMDGILVISIQELVEKHSDDLVIISTKKYADEMCKDLTEKDFPRDNIYCPKYGTLIASCGKQYFDIFDPQDEEVFIDAGAYDGKTMLDYFEWVGKKHKKIYVMEPLKEMYYEIERKVQQNGLKNVSIQNYAAWNKKEQLSFKLADAGSKVCEDDTDVTLIDAIDIDTMVGDKPVTFIKMDIEGSELKALEGAKHTIVNNNPRLAICIYHKPADIVALGSYILKLNPNYKFYIRHYVSNMWETVLYAVL